MCSVKHRVTNYHGFLDSTTITAPINMSRSMTKKDAEMKFKDNENTIEDWRCDLLQQ